MIIQFPISGTPVDAPKVDEPASSEAALALEETKQDVASTFVACHHTQMLIDDAQRTVKCKDCGIWLDPVWCLRKTIWYFQTRVDRRLDELRGLEERYEDRVKRERDRKANPSKRLRARRTDELERAAFNEYQAKRLVLLAERQRARAAKIDEQLGESLSDEVEAAGARQRMKDSVSEEVRHGR